MIVNILMTIGLILIVLSLCTLFSSNIKTRVFNAAVNTLLMGVMMAKNIIEGDMIMSIIFGVLLVIDIVFLAYGLVILSGEKHEDMNPGGRVNTLLERTKFLKEIEEYYGSKRH